VYRIENVPPNAPEDVESSVSKQKFWFSDGQLLFKEAREHSGEDWAEKISAEVARLLGFHMQSTNLRAGSVRAKRYEA
jgi:hypothetical protein